MNTTRFLQLQDITFSFDKKNHLFFENLNASFQGQAIHFIQGRNGVGKSTLFRILSGDIHPQEQIKGKIIIGSQEIACTNSLSFTQAIKKHIKVVQQNIASMLADQFSVKDNLQAALFDHYPTLKSLPRILHYVELLAPFGIFLDSQVQRLSGGQKQILAIIMVLQKKAPILLLDEPTSALDPHNTKLVMDFLHKLCHELGLTILIINHDKEVIENYASHGYFELYMQESGIRAIRRI